MVPVDPSSWHWWVQLMLLPVLALFLLLTWVVMTVLSKRTASLNLSGFGVRLELKMGDDEQHKEKGDS